MSMYVFCLFTERLFLDIDREGEGRVHARATSGWDEKKKERKEKRESERAREGWGKEKRSIDRAFLCDVARARERERREDDGREG